MSDVSFEAADDGVAIFYEGYRFVLAAKKFICPECGGKMTDVNHTHLTEEGGVVALGLGTVCSACGDDTLHIAYPGEPVSGR